MTRMRHKAKWLIDGIRADALREINRNDGKT